MTNPCGIARRRGRLIATLLAALRVTDMKLYFVPKTRSTRPRWVLEELGVPHELVRLDPRKGENRSPEYLKLNPGGHVPTLVDGDTVIFESAAICMQLADQHLDKGLAPKLGTPERGQYYQWLFFAMTELEPKLVQVMLHERFLPEGERDPKVASDNKQAFLKAAKIVEDHLLTHTHLLGADFTVADVVMTSVFAWANWLDVMEDLFPHIASYVQRNLDRAAAKRALSG
jgi:glutathione S-transferase